MHSKIEVHVEFSFKGETHSLGSNLDLNQLLALHDELPSLHELLAKEHGIDTYSYLFEVMQEAEIEFRNAQGNAEKLLSGEDLNPETLAARWQDLRTLFLLQPIAARELGIADLNQHPSLKSAMTQAYNLGKESPSS